MKKYNLLINDIKTPVFTLADLEANARTVSQRADSSMHRVVRLYYLTRYLVVQYETLFGLIPIQVWNEYRNALDHYIRHITDAGSGHVKSMEGHFQRALLDICKLHCHGVGDLFVKRYKEIDGKALTLVDNGNFAGSVRAAQDAANAMFMRAKVIDLALGDDAQQNDEVLSTYLEAAYAHFSLLQMLRDKRSEIDRAYQAATAIKHESRKEHIFLALIAKLIAWVLGLTGAGAIATKLFKLPISF